MNSWWAGGEAAGDMDRDKNFRYEEGLPCYGFLPLVQVSLYSSNLFCLVCLNLDCLVCLNLVWFVRSSGKILSLARSFLHSFLPFPDTNMPGRWLQSGLPCKISELAVPILKGMILVVEETWHGR